MSNDGRRTPPQWVAIVLMVLPTAVCLCVYAAVFTDWFQQAWHGLVWLASQWRVILLILAVPLMFTLGVMVGYLMPATCVVAFHALRSCRLTAGETRRCAFAGSLSMLLVPPNVYLLTLDTHLSMESAASILAFVFSLSVAAGFILFAIAMIGSVPVVVWGWLSPARILLPRRFELRERLERSAKRVKEIGARRFYLNPNPVIGFDLPWVLPWEGGVDEWIHANLADLREYAAYHPEIAGQLTDGRKE